MSPERFIPSPTLSVNRFKSESSGPEIRLLIVKLGIVKLTMLIRVALAHWHGSEPDSIVSRRIQYGTILNVPQKGRYLQTVLIIVSFAEQAFVFDNENHP